MKKNKSRSTQRGTVTSFDGTRIYYQISGSGLPLIFCYGIVCNIPYWKYQTTRFRKKYQVIHFDYRGHNKSASPKKLENLTIKGCTEDLKAVLDKLKIKRAIILGHSMGVNVALQFSALYPKYVEGLVLINGTVTNPLMTMFNTDLTVAGFEFLKMTYLKFPNKFPKLWKKTIPSPLSRVITGLLGFNVQLTKQKDVKTYLNGVAQQPPATFFHFLQEMSEYEGDKILKKIKAPALVIGGAKDYILPIKSQLNIHKKLKTNSQFLKVPQGSHCSHMDLPELINLRVEKFLHELNY